MGVTGSSAFTSQALLEGLARGAKDLDPREVLVVARDERPRGPERARAGHHLVHRLLVLVPLLPVAPVIVTELPALVRRLRALLEALQLLGFRDVQPELHEHDAVLDELILERVDFRVGAAPLGLGREPLDALDEHPPVPAAVVDRDTAG